MTRDRIIRKSFPSQPSTKDCVNLEAEKLNLTSNVVNSEQSELFEKI